MNLEYKENCEGVDWVRVRELLSIVGMATVEEGRHQISFENSYAVIFVYDENKIIGIGRSISDGVRQSALYDIAVDPEYQGHHIGYTIVKSLMSKTPEANFILYASPGKEDFYRRLGMRKMKTGMILFADPEKMVNSPFIDD